MISIIIVILPIITFLDIGVERQLPVGGVELDGLLVVTLLPESGVLLIVLSVEPNIILICNDILFWRRILSSGFVYQRGEDAHCYISLS